MTLRYLNQTEDFGAAHTKPDGTVRGIPSCSDGGVHDDPPATPLPTAESQARHTQRRAATRVTEWAVYFGPSATFLFVFVIVPVGAVIGLAFLEWDPLRGSGTFVGFDNFERILTEPSFRRALTNTIIYILFTVPGTIVISLAVALGIHHVSRGASIWRSAYFLPSAATLAATAVVWRWMFYPGNGFIDAYIGRHLGLTDWLNSPALALPAVAIVGMWTAIGPTSVILLAGLSQVPAHLYEVARIDGARPMSRFIHVTLPGLGPALVFALIIVARDSLRTFDQVRVMTDGEPFGRSETLAYLLWKRGIRFLDLGGASVINLVLLAGVVGFVALQFRVVGHRLERAGSH